MRAPQAVPETRDPAPGAPDGSPELGGLSGGVHGRESRNEQIHKGVCVYGYTLNGVDAFLGLYYSTIGVIAKPVAEAQKHQK